MTITCKKCGQALMSQQVDSPCPKCGSLDRDLTAEERAVMIDKAKTASELAKKHYGIEAGLQRVFRFSGKAEASRSEPVKLLEVNANTVPSGVLPLGFDAAPTSGIDYPSVIVEVTPAEFEKIRTKELKLPQGWEFSEELPKNEGGAGDG